MNVDPQPGTPAAQSSAGGATPGGPPPGPTAEVLAFADAHWFGPFERTVTFGEKGVSVRPSRYVRWAVGLAVLAGVLTAIGFAVDNYMLASGGFVLALCGAGGAVGLATRAKIATKVGLWHFHLFDDGMIAEQPTRLLAFAWAAMGVGTRFDQLGSRVPALNEPAYVFNNGEATIELSPAWFGKSVTPFEDEVARRCSAARSGD